MHHRDEDIVGGNYPYAIPTLVVLVSDAAGVVVRAGAAVSRFAVGDRVTSHLWSRWIQGAPSADDSDDCLGGPLPAGLAEFMLLPAGGGHGAVIGYLASNEGTIDPMGLIARRVRTRGIGVGHRTAFEDMIHFMESKSIKPVIDSTYPFADALAAFDRRRSGAFGKVVIEVGSTDTFDETLRPDMAHVSSSGPTATS